MSKAGLAWECPSCLNPTVPGKKKKGAGYHSKACPECGFAIDETSARATMLVVNAPPPNADGFVTYIDGDDISRRYQSIVPSKWLNTAVSGWNYKNEETYLPPKLLVRQAGVGIVATIDRTKSRCPQSIYIYRLKPEYAKNAYSHEFVLAALLSRTMAYYIFKRFGEIDPAKAHAKLTHQRLSSMPIPRVDFSDVEQRRAHAAVTKLAERLSHGGAALGGDEDRTIELELRKLWGIAPEESAYINREFVDIPDSQIVRDLFPNGIPRGVLLN